MTYCDACLNPQTNQGWLKSRLELVKTRANHLRTFKFDGFLNSITFVNRIAMNANKMNHHPDIDIRFDQVTLTLTTHDEGGITEKDFSLARQCDEVFFKFSIINA